MHIQMQRCLTDPSINKWPNQSFASWCLIEWVATNICVTVVVSGKPARRSVNKQVVCLSHKQWVKVVSFYSTQCTEWLGVWVNYKLILYQPAVKVQECSVCAPRRRPRWLQLIFLLTSDPDEVQRQEEALP